MTVDRVRFDGIYRTSDDRPIRLESLCADYMHLKLAFHPDLAIDFLSVHAFDPGQENNWSDDCVGRSSYRVRRTGEPIEIEFEIDVITWVYQFRGISKGDELHLSFQKEEYIGLGPPVGRYDGKGLLHFVLAPASQSKMIEEEIGWLNASIAMVDSTGTVRLMASENKGCLTRLVDLTQYYCSTFGLTDLSRLEPQLRDRLERRDAEIIDLLRDGDLYGWQDSPGMGASGGIAVLRRGRVLRAWTDW